MSPNKTKFRRPRFRLGSHRRAAATVETAMLIPLLILVSLGATDVAPYINLAQSITTAARHGARFSAKDATQTVEAVEVQVERVFSELFSPCSAADFDLARSTTVTELDGTAINQGLLGNIPSGDPASVQVQVQFDFEAIRWLKGWEYFGFDSVQSETIGRRE
ncbi:MAG: TadE/TadG family type IV pilus assembly protein [Pirellulales bacterium]|jgi:hypothetical protein